MQYGVTAQLQTTGRDRTGVWTGSIQLPWFIVDGDVNAAGGREHAAETARAILDPLGVHGNALHVCAEPITAA